jgi:hypothetical protein
MGEGADRVRCRSDFNGAILSLVMPGLVPGIHVLLSLSKEDVDGRAKPGHDG